MFKDPNSRLGDGYSDVLDVARVREIYLLSQEYMESGGTSQGPDETYSNLEHFIYELFNMIYRTGRENAMTGD